MGGSTVEIGEFSVMIVVSEESIVIEKVCEEEEVNESTFIYQVALWYEPEKHIDNISLSNAETEEEDEVPKYDVVDVVNVDGKEEVIEEINFVVENEIDEAIVEDSDPIYNTIVIMKVVNLVDLD